MVGRGKREGRYYADEVHKISNIMTDSIVKEK